MVNISKETDDQTDRRLLKVMKTARLATFDQYYAFLEFPLDRFPESVRKDALAVVRDEAVWSQLVPCNDPDAELFAIFSFHFPTRVDNSGFVGWLAARLKRKFGTGIFVTCGANHNDGGIFDYWGVPAAIGSLVLTEIGLLMSATKGVLTSESLKSALSLDGVTMIAVASGESSVVSSDTRAEFAQIGDVFSARYSGGDIVLGYLVGRIRSDGTLRFQYAQTDKDGNLDSGTSTGHLTRLADGRLRLTENFLWHTRPDAGQNVFEEPP